MKKWQISSLQAGMLVAGVVALTGHALAVTHFMRAGGRDAWLAGILAFPIAVFAIWCMVKLSERFPGKTVVEYLPAILGYPGYLLSTLYILYYMTVVIFTLRTTMDWLVDTILMETPSWVMGMVYMGTVAYAALGGLDIVARINQFTLPLLTVLGFLVSFATMPEKDYTLLTPMFEHGWGPVMLVTILGLGYYGETSILMMHSAYVVKDERKKLLKAYLLALVFVVTTLTGPLAGSVATLGHRVAEIMPYPTFQHWMMVSFARFFERTDLLAVHQWLAGAFVRCALYVLMAAAGSSQITKQKLNLRWTTAALAFIAVIASEMIFPTKPFFDQFVIRIYLPAGVVMGILLPPLLLGIAALRGLNPGAAKGASTHGA